MQRRTPVPPPTPTGRDSLVRGTTVVLVALAIGQVLGYALNLVAARALGPDSFGAFGALMGVVLIGNVLAFGLQAVAARRLVPLDGQGAAGAGSTVIRQAALGGLVVAGVTALLCPVLDSVLGLGGWLPALLVAVALVPLTLAGGQFGVAQGRESFGRLATVYLGIGIGKSLGGIIGAIVGGTLTATLAGFAAGSLAGAATAQVAVRPLLGRPPLPLPRFTVETLHATHALFALFVLTNVDVLLARALLTPYESGEYAVGAIVAKVAFWLPQFVSVVAFPRMVDERRAATTGRAALVVAGIGLAATAATAALPGLVVGIVGGAQYQDLVPSVWLFAAEGALFAVAQVLLMSRLAVDDRRSVIALWGSAALLVVLAASALPHTVVGVVAAAIAAGAAACAAGVATMLHERRPPG